MLKNSLKDVTMLACIDKAKKHGFSIIISNPNCNYWYAGDAHVFSIDLHHYQ